MTAVIKFQWQKMHKVQIISLPLNWKACSLHHVELGGHAPLLPAMLESIHKAQTSHELTQGTTQSIKSV